MSFRKKLRWLMPTLIGAVLILPILVLILLAMGHISGEEFSPDDFSRRQFSYNRMPFFDWTIIGKEFVDTTGDLEKNLISNGFITPLSNSPKIWHLCDDSAAGLDGDQPTECDARFLTGYLDLTGSESTSYWETWNENHPLVAKHFWPIVAALARNHDYLEIPDLMRIAMSMESDEVAQFEKKLKAAKK